MDPLLGTNGLVAIGIASAVSVVALQTSLAAKRQVSVAGLGNVFVVNEALGPAQRIFRLLWRLLVLAVAVTYPAFGPSYNGVLEALAVIGTPLALVSLIVTLRVYGRSRLPDSFYVLGTALACWLALCSDIYLRNTARSARQIYALTSQLHDGGLPPLDRWPTWSDSLLPLATSCASVAGFAALLLAMLYLMYAYLAARSFDACLRFLLRCGVVAFLGYFAACDGFTALACHDFAYIERLLESVVPV
ncbi:hypothetical protein [Trinickia sp.]|uniref:hypothetical protein n=1 Tax=Trinickia sp. TaxID=2571163 RepID=UPI003F7FB06B